MTDEIRKRLKQLEERGSSLDREIESMMIMNEKVKTATDETAKKDHSITTTPSPDQEKQKESSHHQSPSTDYYYDKAFYVRQGVDEFLFNKQKVLRDKIIGTTNNLMFLRRHLRMTTILTDDVISATSSKQQTKKDDDDDASDEKNRMEQKKDRESIVKKM